MDGEQRMEQEGHSNVVPFGSARKGIQPPSDLAPEELRIFSEVVRSHAPSHFDERDKPLLTVYCAAVHLSALYAEHRGNEAARRMCRQAAKLAAMLADRLRLGSQRSL